MGVMISRLANIPNFIVIGWDPWIRKRIDYLSCTEGKGGFKNIHCIAQNAALFVDLVKNIFYINNLKLKKY